LWKSFRIKKVLGTLDRQKNNLLGMGTDGYGQSDSTLLAQQSIAAVLKRATHEQHAADVTLRAFLNLGYFADQFTKNGVSSRPRCK
jgi:hypothetical protein